MIKFFKRKIFSREIHRIQRYIVFGTIAWQFKMLVIRKEIELKTAKLFIIKLNYFKSKPNSQYPAYEHLSACLFSKNNARSPTIGE